MKELAKRGLQALKKHWVLGLFYIILFGLGLANFLAKIGDNFWSIIAFMGSMLFISLVFLVAFLVQRKYKFGYEKLFLLLAIPFGVIYILIAPLGSGNDDPNHYLRAYEIAQGRMVSTQVDNKVGGEVPKGVIEVLEEEKTYSGTMKMMDTKLGDEYILRNYPNTALYSPISYIPQVTGMLLGKMANASPFWMGTLARISNMVFYILVCFIGFRLLIRFKLFFLILLLSPSIMSNATSLSADAFVVALVFLFVAMVMNLKAEKKGIGPKRAALLVALSVLIAGCKIVYLPAVFLILILDKRCFKTRWGNISLKAACLITGLLVGLIWMKIANEFLAVSYPLASEQMNYIMHNPLQFLVVFVKTMMSGTVPFIENMFSSGPMYHNRVSFSSFVQISFVILAILALFNERKGNILSRRERLYTGFISIAIIGAIAVALYVQWTPQNCGNQIGCGQIVGIQGRYFIPVAAIAVTAIGGMKCRIDRDEVLLYFLVLQVFVIMSIVTAFAG